MLRKKFKWAILPVMAMAMVAGLSAFTGESETIEGHTHALCVTGSSKHCSTRECTTAGCPYQVNVCGEAGFFDSKDCK